MADDFTVEVNNEKVELEIVVFGERLKHATRDIAKEIADYAVDRIKSYAPHGKTGDLRDSVKRGRVYKVGDGNYRTVVKVLAPYAKDVDQGTGRYGPEGKDILAPAGNVFKLMKDPKPGRHEKKPGVVYTDVIKGQKPHHFMDKARIDVDTRLWELVDKELRPVFHDGVDLGTDLTPTTPDTPGGGFTPSVERLGWMFGGWDIPSNLRGNF